jgi:hypothetical protein
LGSSFPQAVHGSSALLAGIQLLPYTLGSSLVSLIGFYVTQKTKAHNAVIRVGLGLMAIGFGAYFAFQLVYRSNPRTGLMTLLNENSNIYMQTLIPLVPGFGVGLLLKTPATALASAMQGYDAPAVTGGLFLVRFIGAASGVVCLLLRSPDLALTALQSVGGAIYESCLAATLPAEFDMDISAPTFDYRLLTTLEPESLRIEVLHAVSRSISVSAG